MNNETTGTQPTTDIPPPTESVEETSTSVDTSCCMKNPICQTDEVDVSEEQERLSDQEDVENSNIYIVRVNDNINGFCYNRDKAVGCAKTLCKLLLMRDTSSYKTYTQEMSDGHIRIYGSYRFMNLLSYDRLLYEVICESVDQL